MEKWKTILLRAAGFGAGFALMGALVLGGIMWWSSRPKKPRPWNEAAITAKYASSGSDKDNTGIYIVYNLKNNPDEDLTITDSTAVHFAAQLKDDSAMSFSNGNILTIETPIFIPAQKTSRTEVHLKYPFNEPYRDSMTDDEKHDFHTKLAKFMANELSNLNGFVILIDDSRYQVNMPPGWVERSKEPLRVKAVAQ